VIEYIGEVLPDGHLSVPEEIRQALAVAPHAQVQVTIKLLQPTADQVQEAWEAFRRLGQDAGQGRLADAAIQHDRYLYSKES
jgi:glutamate/tyrosine decarboxylase-like PLP-dependent enzyme